MKNAYAAGLLLAFVLICPACQSQQASVLASRPAGQPPQPNYTAWVVGDTADAKTQPLGGVVLAGGSADVDEAMRWFLQRANGGDVVIIRASGSNGYNDYLYQKLDVKVNSVETILVNSRALASDTDIIRKMRNAEALFFAGGDQANYVNFYQNTPLADAFNDRIAQGAIIGGTSAGCAILGQLYFSAKEGSIDSNEALSNPFDTRVTIGTSNFLKQPLLVNTLTDQHYTNRNRHGRHLVFLARTVTDGAAQPRGIGIDEKTAVCVLTDGTARVFGQGEAYFLLPAPAKPETCRAGQPLTWWGDGKAVRVTVIPGSAMGTTGFDLKTFTGPDNLKTEYWSVENGQLK
ncbi:cyanophycinase [Spirosoma arcticum]